MVGEVSSIDLPVGPDLNDGGHQAGLQGRDPVNYANIARSVEFYTERGYVYMDDVPWTVGRDAYYATKPVGARDVLLNVQSPGVVSFPSLGTHDQQYPVASAEQSFIQMMLDGQPIKRAIAVT